MAEELLSQKDDDPYYRLLHANALLRVGILAEDPERIRAAEAGALSCLEVGKPKSLVFRLAAECRQRLGDLAGGLAHLNESVRRGLDPPALRAQRSELLRAMGRTEAADEELRAAYQQAPRDRTVRAAWLRRFFAAPR